MTGPAAYDIRVEGHLDDHWSDRLGGLAVTRHADGTSTLTGPLADQWLSIAQAFAGPPGGGRTAGQFDGGVS